MRHPESMAVDFSHEPKPELSEVVEFKKMVDRVVEKTVAKGDALTPQFIEKGFLNKLRNKFAQMVPFLVPALFGAALEFQEPKPAERSFENRALASQQLAHTGITDERRSAYTALSRLLYNAITPVNYQSAWEVMRSIPENLIHENERTVFVDKAGVEVRFDRKKIAEREDAWRLYLGLPQENNTFGVSDYQPENGTENRYYYKVNNFLRHLGEILGSSQSPNDTVKSVVDSVRFSQRTETEKAEMERALNNALDQISRTRRELYQFGLDHREMVDGEIFRRLGFELKSSAPEEIKTHYNELISARERALEAYEELNQENWLDSVGIFVGAKSANDGSIITNDERPVRSSDVPYERIGVMGIYKLSLGHDERGNYISYYDKWDLENNPVEGANGFFGRPFEIYDRIYYDPDTFAVINQE